jgi:uncharacterized iron-regulated protein
MCKFFRVAILKRNVNLLILTTIGMKNLFVVALVLVSMKVSAAKEYVLYDAKGKEVSVEKIFKEAQSKKLVFFGEYHNSATIHRIQFLLTQHLHKVHGDKLMVGAEMFESDNQDIINEYFSGIINTKYFEDECRLWTNYKTDYKPIVEYLKSNKLQLIATNIPRRYAHAVHYNGLDVLDKLPEHVKQLFLPNLPVKIDTTLSSYAEIKQMSMHGGKFMLEAQAVKDATMAHFIMKYWQSDKVFLHLNGAFHTNKYEGIISFLPKTLLRKDMLVISMVTQKDIEKLEDENKGLGDFIFCFEEDYAKSH